MLIAIVRISAFSYASSLSPSSHTTLQRGPGDSCVCSWPHFSKDVLSLGNSDVLKQVVCTYLLFPEGNLNSLYWAICLQEILYLPRQEANLLWSNTPNLLRLLNRQSGKKVLSPSPCKIYRNMRDPWRTVSQQADEASNPEFLVVLSKENDYLCNFYI